MWNNNWLTLQKQQTKCDPAEIKTVHTFITNAKYVKFIIWENVSNAIGNLNKLRTHTMEGSENIEKNIH